MGIARRVEWRELIAVGWIYMGSETSDGSEVEVRGRKQGGRTVGPWSCAPAPGWHMRIEARGDGELGLLGILLR